MSLKVHCAHDALVDPAKLLPNPVNPNQHSAHQIQLLAAIIQEQGWRAPITVSNRSGLIVRGHRQLLAQALSNLIDNALKYGRGTPVALTLRHSGGVARLEVSDGGPGIPAEHRELATQRFRRLPGSSGLPGSGLGLSLVAAVARLHHARLELADAAPGLRVVLEIPILATPR